MSLAGDEHLAADDAAFGPFDEQFEAPCDGCGADVGEPCKTLCPNRIPI